MLAAIFIIVIIVIIDIIKDSLARTSTSGLREECYSTGFPEDKYVHKLGSNQYVKSGPNFKTSIALTSQLDSTHYIHVLFSSTLNTAYYGLNYVPSKRYVKVLTPNMSECDLIWQ